MRKENTTISVAKGIGICLVLIGHFTFIPEVKRFIYCFHMPLFFFLSGYLFKDREISDLPGYVRRKIKSLYVPFILCNLIALPFHNLLCSVGVYKAEDAFTGVRQLLPYVAKIFFCIKMEDIVAPMWFLPILMAVSIAYFVLRAAVKRNEMGTGIATLLGYAAAYLLMYMGKSSGLWRAMILIGVGLWVFHLGHLYRGKEGTVKRYCHNATVVLICLIAEIGLSLVVDINMIQMRFSNPLAFTVCALLGINVVMFAAEAIRKQGALRCLGNDSLTVLEWHYWGALITTALQAVVFKGSAEGIIFYQGPIRWLWFISYCITGLGLPLVFIQVKKKLIKT